MIKTAVNYDDHEALVAALQGSQFLVICIGVTVSQDTQIKICKAAKEAGVRYVMPSFFGSDIRNPKLGDDRFGAAILKTLADIQELGLSYITLVCGVWYEWSLALGEPWFGFDIPQKKVTFYDDGDTIVTTSTWEQCGRAVAALLSLPETGSSPALSDWSNKPLYISSFRISQRDMLSSLHHVLGTTEGDWQITYETTAKRQEDGAKEFAAGARTGLAKSMYAKHFMNSRAGDLEYRGTTANVMLGLPEESLDEATKRAVEMVESGWNPQY